MRPWPIEKGHDRRKAGPAGPGSTGQRRRARAVTRPAGAVVVAPAQSPAAGAPKVLLLSGQLAAAAGAPGWPGSAGGGAGPARSQPGGASGVRPRRASDSASRTLSPEEKALRRWARSRLWGPKSKAGQGPGAALTACSVRAPVSGRSGASVARRRAGAGQGRKSDRPIHCASGVQGSAGLFFFFNFFRFCLVRDDQSRVRWHLLQAL